MPTAPEDQPICEALPSSNAPATESSELTNDFDPAEISVAVGLLTPDSELGVSSESTAASDTDTGTSCESDATTPTDAELLAEQLAAQASMNTDASNSSDDTEPAPGDGTQFVTFTDPTETQQHDNDFLYATDRLLTKLQSFKGRSSMDVAGGTISFAGTLFELDMGRIAKEPRLAVRVVETLLEILKNCSQELRFTIADEVVRIIQRQIFDAYPDYADGDSAPQWPRIGRVAFSQYKAGIYTLGMVLDMLETDLPESSKEALMFALIHNLRRHRSTSDGGSFPVPIVDPVDVPFGYDMKARLQGIVARMYRIIFARFDSDGARLATTFAPSLDRIAQLYSINPLIAKDNVLEKAATQLDEHRVGLPFQHGSELLSLIEASGPAYIRAQTRSKVRSSLLRFADNGTRLILPVCDSLNLSSSDQATALAALMRFSDMFQQERIIYDFLRDRPEMFAETPRGLGALLEHYVPLDRILGPVTGWLVMDPEMNTRREWISRWLFDIATSSTLGADGARDALKRFGLRLPAAEIRALRDTSFTAMFSYGAGEIDGGISAGLNLGPSERRPSTSNETARRVSNIIQTVRAIGWLDDDSSAALLRAGLKFLDDAFTDQRTAERAPLMSFLGDDPQRDSLRFSRFELAELRFLWVMNGVRGRQWQPDATARDFQSQEWSAEDFSRMRRIFGNRGRFVPPTPEEVNLALRLGLRIECWRTRFDP